MSTQLDILNGIKADLHKIKKGNTVDIQGVTYTYQTDLGENIYQGLVLSDLELQPCPTCSINGIVGAMADDDGLPDIDIVMAIAVEASAIIENGDNWITLGDKLLSDIRAAVNLNASRHSGHIGLMKPGAPNQPVFEYLQPNRENKFVMVRRWYQATFAESFPD